jgi:hypothetical protein
VGGGSAGASGAPAGGSDGSGGSGAAGGGDGGSSAGGAGAGSGASGASGASGVNAVVADDFEGVAPGSPPNPALWSVRGSGAIQVSTEQVRPGGGARAVKVVSGSSGATMFVNTSAFPLPNGVIHFRVWMYFVNGDWANHIGFVASSPGSEGQEVRFGGQANAYHANLAADGDGLSPDPFQYPSCTRCVAPVPNQWACLRGMFDFPGNRARLYVNEQLAVDAEQDSVKNDWHAGTGTLPQNPTEIAFGWALYGGVQNTVYYDDLALGYEPMPCE